MDLNPEQQKAINELEEFLHSNRNFHILSGPAGSGKTFLLKYFLENTLEDYNNSNKLLGVPQRTPILTAMTHKAVKVLKDTIPSVRPCTTLHSYLGISLNRKGEPVFLDITGKNNHLRILVVDEASMMDYKVWDYLKRSVYTLGNIKVLLIGDRNQLTVKGNTSGPCVFYAGIPASNLVTPIRQSKQVLRDLCTYIKQCKEIGSLPVLDNWFNNQEIQHMSMEDTLIFHTRTEHPILCYSNNKVMQWNINVRKKRGLPTYPVQGDRILFNRSKQIPLPVLIKVDSIEDYGSMSKINKKYILAKNQSTERNEIIGNTLIFWRFPYAMTIHKSQGSTYDGVIIDLGSFNKCTNRSMFLSLLYVAVSRAREQVIFTGQLPTRFTGQST